MRERNAEAVVGLAGATPAWARTAIGLAQRVAEVMADEPESV